MFRLDYPKRYTDMCIYFIKSLWILGKLENWWNVHFSFNNCKWQLSMFRHWRLHRKCMRNDLNEKLSMYFKIFLYQRKPIFHLHFLWIFEVPSKTHVIIMNIIATSSNYDTQTEMSNNGNIFLKWNNA